MIILSKLLLTFKILFRFNTETSSAQVNHIDRYPPPERCRSEGIRK